MNTIEELIDACSNNQTLTIQGQPRQIAGMAKFTSKHFPNDSYIKVSFAGHKYGLVILITQQQVFLSESIGKIDSISDDQLQSEEITFRDTSYKLVNANDYQFTQQILVGSFNDIEGECMFSDYEPTDGSKAMLSLGILSYTQQRADVFAIQIDLGEITI